MRLSLAAAACMALAVAAVFLVRSESQLSEHREALQVLDGHARDVLAALGEIRAGEQAYVAAGQGIAFWMPKVAAASQEVANTLTLFRDHAKTNAAKSELDEAAAGLKEFRSVDARARDYIRSRQEL